jgi:hypothetical protein
MWIDYPPFYADFSIISTAWRELDLSQLNLQKHPILQTWDGVSNTDNLA